MSNKIKEGLAALKNKMDTNEDGIVQSRELLNPNNVKIILVTILSLLLPEMITWIQLCIANESFQANGMFGLLQIVIVPFVLIYFFRSVLEDYQGKLKAKDEQIETLKEDLKTEQLDRRDDHAKAEIEVLQLEGAIETKKMEIEWIREGYNLPEKSE